jgi:hypothetical protein
MGVFHSAHAMKSWKGELVADRLMQAAGGLEAEFSLLVDDVPVRPEDVFGDPRGFITAPLLHRTGSSFQLPNGAVVYFDTGVIEVATPVMELDPGCFGRLARSLDTGVAFVREQLDAWERRTGHRTRLQGFSAHYNVSIGDGESATASPSPRIRDLAWLLVHVLPAPVMLLATNKRSTGVGLRPRPRRIELTVDYSPDPARVAATGALIAGIVTAVSRWPNLDVETLRARGIPVVEGFRPTKHTSRRGWLARYDSYPANPFESCPNEEIWMTHTGRSSLRGIAQRVFEVFRGPIRRIADPFSFEIATRVLSGASRSWLDDAERPVTYDNVGRGPARHIALDRLGFSRYERVVLNAMAHKSLLLGADRWTPIGVLGWSRVVFRRDRDGARAVLPLDTLVERLSEWDAA